MRAKLFAAVLRVRRKKPGSYQIWYNMRINMSNVKPMGIAYPPRPLAEPRSGRYAGGKSAASEGFGCISHGRGAYAAAGNEDYCGNLLWQSNVTLLPPGGTGIETGGLKCRKNVQS